MMNKGVWLKVDTEAGTVLTLFGTGGVVLVEPTSIKGQLGSFLKTADGRILVQSKWTPEVISKFLGEALE